jgi:hypothetical protein
MGELYTINDKIVTLFQKDIEWYKIDPIGARGDWPIITEDIKMDLSTARTLTGDHVLLTVMDLIRHWGCRKCNSKDVDCITSMLQDLHDMYPKKIKWHDKRAKCFLIDMTDSTDTMLVWVSYREKRNEWIFGVVQIIDPFLFISFGCALEYTRMVDLTVDEFKKFASEINPLMLPF